VQIEGKAPPMLPPKRGQLMMVPKGIRPQLQRTAIEVSHSFANLTRLHLFVVIFFTWMTIFKEIHTNIIAACS